MTARDRDKSGAAPTPATTRRARARAEARPPLPVDDAARALVLQAKLQVGAANDPLETDADRIADGYLRWQAGDAAEGRVARSTAPAAGAGSITASPDVERRIEAARGRGAALPDATRRSFEGFFGTDLTGVRVHRGAESAVLNDALAARAFTTGSDVFLGADAGAPGADSHLLAHELAHVVQQGGAIARVVRREELDKDAAEKHKQFEGVTPAVAAATAMKGVKTGGDLAGQAEELGDAPESVPGLALTASLCQFYESLKLLFEARRNRVGEEDLRLSLEAVMRAGQALQKATGFAGAFGAKVAMVVPGLDVAVSSVTLLVHLSKVLMLTRSSIAESAALASVDPTSDKGRALGLAHSRTLRTAGFNFAKLAGDVTMLTGSVLALTGVAAPAGAVLKIVGVVATTAAQFGEQIAEHFEAKAVAAARANYEQAAEKAGTASPEDPDALDAAKSQRLSVDLAFAVDELLGYVAGAPESVDEEVAAVLATYGIGKNWLQRYNEAGRPRAHLDEARASIVRYLESEENPKTVWRKLGGIVVKAKEWITKKVRGDGGAKNPERAHLTALKEAMATVVMWEAASRPQSGAVTAEPLTNALAPTYQQLTKDVGAWKPDEREAYLDAVDAGMTDAVRHGLTVPPGYDRLDIVVSRGTVVFPPFDVVEEQPSVPTPEAEPALAAG